MIDNSFHIIQELNNKFEKHTPNVWPDIKAKLARQVAEQLLEDLSGLP